MVNKPDTSTSYMTFTNEPLSPTHTHNRTGINQPLWPLCDHLQNNNHCHAETLSDQDSWAICTHTHTYICIQTWQTHENVHMQTLWYTKRSVTHTCLSTFSARKCTFTQNAHTNTHTQTKSKCPSQYVCVLLVWPGLILFGCIFGLQTAGMCSA